MKLRNVVKGENIKPIEIAGKGIKVFLKDGGAFFFKVTGYVTNEPLACIYGGNEPTFCCLDGYDDEYLNLRIDVKDIDFIIA